MFKASRCLVNSPDILNIAKSYWSAKIKNCPTDCNESRLSLQMLVFLKEEEEEEAEEKEKEEEEEEGGEEEDYLCEIIVTLPNL